MEGRERKSVMEGRERVAIVKKRKKGHLSFNLKRDFLDTRELLIDEAR